jgi:hypothetical protein
MTTFIKCAALAAFLAPAAAQAQGMADASSISDQGVESTPTHKDSHEGFMLRMSSGYAAVGVGIQPKYSEEIGAAAGGPTLNVMIGRSVLPNLILHADLMGVGANDVRAKEDGSNSFKADGFGMAAAGFGVSYYIMPYNLSLTGSMMYAGFGLETQDDDHYTTDYALLAKLGIAKEWAVSESWGLGVGGTAFFGSAHGEDQADESFDAGLAGGSINFIATYN